VIECACPICSGTKKVTVTAPASGPNPYVTLVQIVCGACSGTGIETITGPAPEVEESKEGKPLRKPMVTGALRKVSG
jgi:hypothetical protein